MNYKLLVDTAMLTGEIMLLGGAETYRVEDTMCRILKISGLEKTETFVTPTGIFLTLGDSNIDSITVVKRVDNRITNISHIYEANNVSRKLCDGKITLEEAYESLKNIKNKKQYSSTVNYLCTMIAALSFTILLGGDWLNSIIAGLNGGLIVLILIISKNLRVNTFIKNLVSSILIAFNSMFFLHNLGLAIQLDALIGGSVMPLLPGVAITNAIRDTLQGDYMSGGARAIEAFVSATSTAAGIGIGIAFYSFIAGGIAV
ncbi:threonine/serine exporter family protein [Anaerocolumna sedimenticola]|nr:threonine/serine exporter family protein [Anaerocolumna sedimenticola]